MSLRRRERKRFGRIADRGIEGIGRLERRVWYGGRKGRVARRRLEATGAVVYTWHGCPAWHPRCEHCGAPRLKHGYEHWDHCPAFAERPPTDSQGHGPSASGDGLARRGSDGDVRGRKPVSRHSGVSAPPGVDPFENGPRCARCGHAMCPICRDWCNEVVETPDGVDVCPCFPTRCDVPIEVLKAWWARLDAEPEASA